MLESVDSDVPLVLGGPNGAYVLAVCTDGSGGDALIAQISTVVWQFESDPLAVERIPVAQGLTGVAMRNADVRSAGFFASIRIRLVLLCLAGTAAVVVLPRLNDHSRSTLDLSRPMPNIFTLLVVGLALTFFTVALLFLGMKRSMRFSNRVWTYALAYNVLIIGVKFVLGPASFYLSNANFELNGAAYIVGGFFMALVVGVAVLAVYLAVFTGMFLVYRSRLDVALKPERRGGTAVTARDPGRAARVALLGLLLFVTVGVSLFLLLAGGFEYIVFVFATPIAILTAVMLAGAVRLATAAFGSVTQEALALRDATLLTTFFWLGVSLLLIYHALWVVYFFVLASVWPLNVNVPK